MKIMFAAALISALLIGCAGQSVTPTPATRSPQFSVATCPDGYDHNGTCATPTPISDNTWIPVFTPDPYYMPLVQYRVATVTYPYTNCKTYPYPGGIIMHCLYNGSTPVTDYIPQYPINFPPPPMHPHCFFVGVIGAGTTWWAVESLLQAMKAGSIVLGPEGRLIWIGVSGTVAMYHGC